MKEYVTSFKILPQFVLAGTEEATEELRKFYVSDEIRMTHLYNPSQKTFLFMFFNIALPFTRTKQRREYFLHKQ